MTGLAFPATYAPYPANQPTRAGAHVVHRLRSAGPDASKQIEPTSTHERDAARAVINADAERDFIASRQADRLRKPCVAHHCAPAPYRISAVPLDEFGEPEPRNKPPATPAGFATRAERQPRRTRKGKKQNAET
jgi:hypothetical protein